MAKQLTSMLDMGSKIAMQSGNPIGMGIGAGYQLLAGLTGNFGQLKKERDAQIAMEAEMMKQAQRQRSEALIGQFPTAGNGAVFRAYGGSLMPLSSDGGKFVGNSHANGGIQIPGVGEVEGGEALTKSSVGMPTIASNRISIDGVPMSDIVTKHEAMKGKLESKLTKRPGDPFIQNSVDMHQGHIDQVLEAQKSVNQMMGNEQGYYAMGGELYKVPITSLTQLVANTQYKRPKAPQLQSAVNFEKVSNDPMLVEANRAFRTAMANANNNPALIGNIAAQGANAKARIMSDVANTNADISNRQTMANAEIQARNLMSQNQYSDENTKFDNELVNKVQMAFDRDTQRLDLGRNAKTASDNANNQALADLVGKLGTADPRVLQYLGIDPTTSRQALQDLLKKLMTK